MRRRDFLAGLAAVLAGAVVPVKASEDGTTLRVVNDWRWSVPNGYQLLVWDGSQWVDTPNGAAITPSAIPATMTFRAAQPRHSA